MIIRVLIAVVLAVPAYFYTMRYNIHMFQQNGYKNKEHIHWLKKKFRLQWILYFGLALGIVTCVFPYLALEIFEYLVLLVIIVVYRAMKRMNTKKKLVYTARVKRLLTTELILTAAVFALVWIGRNEADPGTVPDPGICESVSGYCGKCHQSSHGGGDQSALYQ